MFRFKIRDVLWLMVVVLVGAFVGGTWNAAVSSGPEETVYQWMQGFAFGGLAAACIYWLYRSLQSTTLGNSDSHEKHLP